MYQTFNNALLPRITTGGVIDIGAYEFGSLAGTEFGITNDVLISSYPNPSIGQLNIELPSSLRGTITLKLYNSRYEFLTEFKTQAEQHHIMLSKTDLSDGIYILRFETNELTYDKKIIVIN